MAGRLDQDELGRCAFIDALEEAVLRRGPVAVELRDGTCFIDRLSDVVTESGRDVAVFDTHARVAVEAIRSVSRSESAKRSRG